MSVLFILPKISMEMPLKHLSDQYFWTKDSKKHKKLFIRNVLNKYLDLNVIVNTDTDYKSLVFEWVQKHKSNLIFTYNEEYDFKLKKSVFSTTLIIDKEELGEGHGLKKRG